MKPLFLIFASILSISSACYAQSLQDSSEARSVWNNELPKVKGLVRRIDAATSKIQLKHEEIPNLSMPAMTMSFVVPDPEMTKNLKPNDKVLFSADMIDNELTLVWIEKQN